MDISETAWIIGAVIAALLGIAGWVFLIAHYKKKLPTTSKKDRIIGFLFFGPAFNLVQKDLARRGYKLSRRELIAVYVFLVIFALGIVAVILAQ